MQLNVTTVCVSYYANADSIYPLCTKMLWIQDDLMKSKLSIIAGVITIAWTAVPAQAVPVSVLENRSNAVGYLASMQCLLNSGKASKEMLDEYTFKYLNENPDLKPGVAWVSSNVNGQSAIQAVIPYLNSDCNGYKPGSKEKLVDLLLPLLD